MESFQYLINVILPDGSILNYGSIYNKDLYHYEALDLFLKSHPEFEMPQDFYERISKFPEDGNVLFISTSYDFVKQGQLFLPIEITKEQYNSIDNMCLHEGNIYVTKDGVDLGFTHEFNIGDYYGKVKYR